MARKGVAPKSSSVKTGQRLCMSSSTANTGWRVSWAVMHGPAPTVNWSRSASSDASELAPSGIRCCDASTRLRLASALAEVTDPALAGPGAIDLYFRRSAEVLALDVFEAVAVGELVTSALSDAAVWSEWTPGDGPDWLHGAVPERRAAVWEAMGKVSVELEVSTPEALELLRAHAYGRGLTVDDVAEELLSGELRAAELEDGAAEAG